MAICSQKMSWKGHFLSFCFFLCFGKHSWTWVSLNRALIRCDKAHICGMIDCSITFIIVLESAKIHLTMKGRTKRKPFIFHGFSQKNIWLCFHENMLDNWYRILELLKRLLSFYFIFQEMFYIIYYRSASDRDFE